MNIGEIREAIQRLSPAARAEIARCLRECPMLEDDSFSGLIASEQVLTKDWSTPGEDAVWAKL